MAVAEKEAETGAVYNESTKKVLAYADNELDILLIGKTGNGKSKTGNTILGRDYFEECSSCESVTQSVSTGVVKFGDRVIKVVDGPGVGDTSGIKDLEKATLLVIESMKNAVNFSPQGYHAFLLVVKYGGRFTNEDFECIRLLKNIFGEDIVKLFCILVVTHGDIFAKDKKNRGKTFLDWCNEQKGVFKDLLTECNNRVILFDNNSTDEKVISTQVSSLINMIDNLQHGGRRYNLDNFQQTESRRKIIMVKSKEPKLRDDIINKLTLIVEDYKKIKEFDEHATQTTAIQKCLKEIQDLLSAVLQEDDETNVFADLINQIKGQEAMMEQKLLSLKKMSEFELKLNESDRKHQEEQEKLNNIIISSMEEQKQHYKALAEQKKIMDLEVKNKEAMIRQLQAENEQKQRELLEQEKLKHDSDLVIMQNKIADILKDKEMGEQEREKKIKELEKREQQSKEEFKQKEEKIKLQIQEQNKAMEEKLKTEKEVQEKKSLQLTQEYNARKAKLEQDISYANREKDLLSRELDEKKKKMKLFKANYEKICEEQKNKINDTEKEMIKMKLENQNLLKKLEQIEKEKAQSIEAQLKDLQQRVERSGEEITKQEKEFIRKQYNDLKTVYGKYFKKDCCIS